MIDRQSNLITQKAVITNSNNKILLLQRSSDLTWELPGGILKNSESLESSLKREIFEEIGLPLKKFKLFNVSLFDYGEFNFSDGSTQDSRFIVITYKTNCEEKTIKLSSEHVSYNWFTKLAINSLTIYKSSISSIDKWIKEI